MLYVGIGFLVFGSIFQAIGIMVRNSAGGHKRAKGTITDLRYSVDREFGQVAYPEVTFTLPDGQTIVAESSSTAAIDDGEVVGAEVDVRYDPNDPQKIEVGQASKTIGTVFLGFGIGFDVLGVVLIVLSAL